MRVRWWMVSPHSDIYLCDALVPWLGGVRGTVKVAVNGRWGENKARSAREKTFLSSLWRKMRTCSNLERGILAKYRGRKL